MSKIEWTNQTWNPIIGCSKTSPGCDNCYAEKMAHRISMIELFKHGAFSEKRYYKNVTEGAYSGAGWNGKTYFVKSALEKPLKRKKPTKYFVCSMGDLFHESVPFEWIDKVMAIIAVTPHHTYQILTKRPERMLQYFKQGKYILAGRLSHASYEIGLDDPDAVSCFIYNTIAKEPLKNLWLGVSAENQEQADKRIPILLQIPAAKRFVSIEPMLGEIELNKVVFERVYGTGLLNALTGNKTDYYGGAINGTNKLDWVILGGESGHKARPMHPDWVRSIRDQCQAANVPFFFKQWGEFLPGCQVTNIKQLGRNSKQFQFSNNPDKINYYKISKKKAGRLLDGKEYKEFPKS